MWRRTFGAVAAFACAAPASAQRVPGRDLLEFPISTAAEAPLLATLSRDGLWNPANILLDSVHRARLSAAALDGPSQQGIAAQNFSIALPLGSATTFALSLLHASVRDLPRTEGDPQSVGDDIRYGTTLIYGSVARRFSSVLNGGLSFRFRRGVLDDEVRSSAAVDLGVLVNLRGSRDARIAASTFLFQPAWGGNSESRFSLGADLRVAGGRDELQLRGGYSLSHTKALATEHYLFLSGRVQVLELNGGLLVSDIHGRSSNRSRFGVALRSSTVAVGLSREENSSGIAPAYQVMITTYLLKR